MEATSAINQMNITVLDPIFNELEITDVRKIKDVNNKCEWGTVRVNRQGGQLIKSLMWVFTAVSPLPLVFFIHRSRLGHLIEPIRNAHTFKPTANQKANRITHSQTWHSSNRKTTSNSIPCGTQSNLWFKQLREDQWRFEYQATCSENCYSRPLYNIGRRYFA